MRKIITTGFFLLYFLTGFSQLANDSIKDLISTNIEILLKEARKGRTHYYDVKLITPISEHLEIAYPFFKKYENDSNQYVKYVVISNYQWLKNISNNVQFRQNVVCNLLQLYKWYKNSYYLFDKVNIDIPSGLSDPDESKTTDFNVESKKILSELMQDSTFNRDILKIVGISGMKNLVSELRKFLPKGKRYQKPKTSIYPLYFYSVEWYARLAMARLGNQEQIEYCVGKVKNGFEEIMSNPYIAGEHFEDLAYIKKLEILPFLFEMLLANKKFKDDPLYSTSGFAITALRKLLKNFPPEQGFSLTKKGVNKYKKWIRKYRGRYEFKD